MSTSPQNQPSFGTYFVHDQQNEEELHRLVGQDRFVTASMGGVLSEQADPSAFRRVLDIACGSGGWVIEAAQMYPEIALVGIDLNQRMLAYAREQAAAQHVDDRVAFRVMDALGVLGFPDASFDLVNLRFAISFVRTWEWHKLLREMLRVLRPGGVIRLTDEEVIHQSTSRGAMQFCEMLLCALFRSGHLFTQDSSGLTAHLAPLLSQAGCQDVQTRNYALQFRAGTPEGLAYAKDGEYLLRTFRPFLQKWGCMSKEYEDRQTLAEIRHPDFSATWHLLTAWGTKPKPEAPQP
jgi:ubiquinone/menaquinone biosynthesis C-methylase UbiE